MDTFKALYLGMWDSLKESNVPLEPLELSKLEQDIIIARMKKLAKDPAYNCANALELVHDSYKEQDWERQSEHGEFVRPRPSNTKAWKQYEKFIMLSVKFLSKFRGIKGDWRTDRFATLPTNDRSSIGSMAAAQVESWSVTWNNPVKSQIVIETLENSTIFQRSGQFSVNFDDYFEHLTAECNRMDYAIMEGISENDNTVVFHIYNFEGDEIDIVELTPL